MLHEIFNEFFRLRVLGIRVQADESAGNDSLRLFLDSKWYSVTIAQLLRILQPLPDASGTIPAKRALRRSLRYGQPSASR